MSSNETITGPFRIVLAEGTHFDAFDLERGFPVVIARAHEDYDEELRTAITDIDAGYKIEATLVKTGDTYTNQLFDADEWRFESVTVSDATRIYHAFAELPIIAPAQRLTKRLAEENRSYGRTPIVEDEEQIGFIVVFHRNRQSPTEPIFETELERLATIRSPPYCVFQTATQDGQHFVHYYVADPDSRTAAAFRTRIDAGAKP